MLRDLQYKRIYRSTTESLDKDFLIPALAQATTYDRGAGFFTLEAFSTLAVGLVPFLKNGGKIRIVTSVELSEEDSRNILNGVLKSEACITDELLRLVEEELDAPDAAVNMDLLTNLIAIGRIEVKVAYLPDGGIYHEKIGFLFDKASDCVFFSGSQNETHYAYRKNVESLTALCDWVDDSTRQAVAEEHEYFNDLWNNRQERVQVMDFPEAVQKRLLQRFKVSPTVEAAIEKRTARPATPKKKVLFPYQKDAIQAFIGNQYCHFYEMATGTGKTFTALKTIHTIIRNRLIPNVQVVILVPQIDLQEQWYAAMQEMGFTNIHQFGGGKTATKDIESEISQSVIESCMSEPEYSILLSVYDTYFMSLNEVLRNEYDVNKMLVVDEAHALNERRLDALTKVDYVARLGLSATPERNSQQATDALIKFFTNGTVDPFRYTIEEAIQNGFLSHYEYYPLESHLTEDEFEQFSRYTKQIGILSHNQHRTKDEESRLNLLRNMRSLVVKKAIGKLHTLKAMLDSGRYSFRNAVVYCGQGKEPDSDVALIDRATELLAHSGLRVSQFTSLTAHRKQVLEEFERGFYETLVAIKCFDQGVDVPKLDKIYILASDTSHRQTVQRRGRVLRICKSTGKTLAYIYDMVVLPPEGVHDTIGVQALLTRETQRVLEYARLADNREYAENFMKSLEVRYGSLDSFSEDQIIQSGD